MGVEERVSLSSLSKKEAAHVSGVNPIELRSTTGLSSKASAYLRCLQPSELLEKFREKGCNFHKFSYIQQRAVIDTPQSFSSPGS